MARYTYLACDWATRQPILELPMYSPSFGYVLNGIGDFNGEVSLAKRASDVLSATDPARTVMFIDRDGVLVWGGWIWTRVWDRKTGRLKISGADYFSYFWHRYLRSSLFYTQEEQIYIANDLITTAQALSNGDVGVDYGTFIDSGVLRDREYNWEDTKNIGELIQQLSALSNGFDFSFDAGGSLSDPTISFNKFYPKKGVSAANTTYVFEYPGNIVTYDWPEDGMQKANYVLGVGGTAIDGLGSTNKGITSYGLIGSDPTYPVLDYAFNDSNIVTGSTMSQRVIEELRLRQGIVTVPKLIVRGDLAPMFGSYAVGDYCKVSLTDDRFPSPGGGLPGKEASMRIVGINVKPAQSSAAEEVTLTVDAAV